MGNAETRRDRRGPAQAGRAFDAGQRAGAEGGEVVLPARRLRVIERRRSGERERSRLALLWQGRWWPLPWGLYQALFRGLTRWDPSLERECIPLCDDGCCTAWRTRPRWERAEFEVRVPEELLRELQRRGPLYGVTLPAEARSFVVERDLEAPSGWRLVEWSPDLGL